MELHIQFQFTIPFKNKELRKTYYLFHLGLQAPPPNVVLQQKGTTASQPANYQLVMDPRLGLIVGTMTPTTPVTQPTISPQVQTKPASATQGKPQQKQTRSTRTKTTTSTAVAAAVQQKTTLTTQPIVIKSVKHKVNLSVASNR